MASRTPRTQNSESQAAGRLRVPISSWRWAVHAGVVPAPDVSAWQWSRAAVEAMDPAAITASMPREPIAGSAAADRLAIALGTPDVPDEAATVTSFVVRRLIDRDLLTELSGNHGGSLLNPDQVDQVGARPDLGELVAALSPLGPNQAATRLNVRRTDFDHMVRLSWVTHTGLREVRFGTSRAGAVDVPLYLTADVAAVPSAHAEIDWTTLRAIGKGRRSPLAALTA